MRLGGIAVGAGLVLLAALAVALAATDRVSATPPPREDASVLAVRAELGRRLFYDADLSVNGTLSCASCHSQRHAFATDRATHPGALDDPGRRNPMSLANVAGFRVFTWADTRHATLEDQAGVPIAGEHPVEMGMAGRSDELARRLGADPCYRRAFSAAFPQGGDISQANVTRALAAFERTLVSTDSAYDRALHGGEPLSPFALRGRQLFESRRLGCAGCHAGPLFTDAAGPGDARASFHDIGTATPDDPGLSEITGAPGDQGHFRTPSLRNVALTGPYLHDGSARTLQDAILRHRPSRVDPADLPALIGYLQTLTDITFVSNRRFALPPANTCPA